MKSNVFGKVLATLVLTIVTSLSASAQVVNHDAEEVDPFYATIVNVPSKVRFVEGDRYSVEVVAADEEVEQGIRCNVIRGILYISLCNGMEAEYMNSEDVSIVITVPATNMANLTTSRNFVID